MSIALIVATDQQHGIGANNQLIWHLPADLKYFKQLTTGHAIIMGRKTYDSIGKPLPNRHNIVITRNKTWQAQGVTVVHSLQEAVNLCKNENSFIIGGAEIYNQALHFAEILFVTQVHETFKIADTFFPKIDFNIWQEIARIKNMKDQKHDYDFDFVTYHKIKND